MRLHRRAAAPNLRASVGATARSGDRRSPAVSATPSCSRNGVATCGDSDRSMTSVRICATPFDACGSGPGSPSPSSACSRSASARRRRCSAPWTRRCCGRCRSRGRASSSRPADVMIPFAAEPGNPGQDLSKFVTINDVAGMRATFRICGGVRLGRAQPVRSGAPPSRQRRRRVHLVLRHARRRGNRRQDVFRNRGRTGRVACGASVLRPLAGPVRWTRDGRPDHATERRVVPGCRDHAAAGSPFPGRASSGFRCRFRSPMRRSGRSAATSPHK